jgi:hypothetical protein
MECVFNSDQLLGVERNDVFIDYWYEKKSLKKRKTHNNANKKNLRSPKKITRNKKTPTRKKNKNKRKEDSDATRHY